ncbi:MAG: hypothetical protein M0R73_05195 [Dehalococcoidia bacterium]|nr:hypothetical protein [Dehalococcoidia bacterium]
MHTHDEGGGIASGMVIGIVLAVLVAVLLAFFLFGGLGTSTDDDGDLGLDNPVPTVDPGGANNEGGGSADGAPSSFQYYIVPDYQVTVR